jgi:hypothetical protein
MAIDLIAFLAASALLLVLLFLCCRPCAQKAPLICGNECCCCASSPSESDVEALAGLSTSDDSKSHSLHARILLSKLGVRLLVALLVC